MLTWVTVCETGREEAGLVKKTARRRLGRPKGAQAEMARLSEPPRILSHWEQVRRQAGWSSAAEATPQELGTGRGVLTALSWTARPSSRSIWTACPSLSTTILKASAPRPLSSLVLAVLLLLSPLTFRVSFFMKCLLYSYLQNSPEERNAIEI